MDFILNSKERAQKSWIGFLYKTKIECEKEFKWISFEIKGKLLEGYGSLEFNGRIYHFKLLYSPFYPIRFERIMVETKNLIKSADTHFNGDGSLCLYHPILDLKGQLYHDLVGIIPWISEWIYYYDKYLEYKIWLGPEYPHN